MRRSVSGLSDDGSEATELTRDDCLGGSGTRAASGFRCTYILSISVCSEGDLSYHYQLDRIKRRTRVFEKDQKRELGSMSSQTCE